MQGTHRELPAYLGMGKMGAGHPAVQAPLASLDSQEKPRHIRELGMTKGLGPLRAPHKTATLDHHMDYLAFSASNPGQKKTQFNHGPTVNLQQLFPPYVASIP